MRLQLLAVVCALTSGCVWTTYRVHADGAGWRDRARTVAILADARAYLISAGEVREEQEEWSAESGRFLQAALRDGLSEQGLRVKEIRPKGDAALDELRLLCGEVAVGVRQFAYPPYPNPAKVERFDYGVGPIGDILDRAGADLLLVAWARHNESTGGRILARLGGGAYSLSGVVLGLIDRKGRLLFFDMAGSGFANLRDEAQVRSLVGGMLTHLREAGR